MRTFFILVFFFAAFIVLVTSLLVGVDLTPNTPVITQAVAPTSQPQVVTVQESPVTTGQSNTLLPVTGGCANPYTVRSGDSLSRIAVYCNTTLAAIRQANLQIINANLIYPGQQIHIPDGSTGQIPVTGVEAADSIVYLRQSFGTASDPVIDRIPIIQSLSGLQVRVIDFPSITPVNIAIGPQSADYSMVISGVTDASGNLTTRIIVPIGSNSQTLWVVVVSTTDQSPPIWATSQPFHVVGP